MIESIRATNFQSLHNVDLELGKFTVIVGASSSGKSAVTRAIKAVAWNALDSDYITRGTNKSSVSLRTGEATVTIERDSGGSSVYKIAKTGSEESRFARLNRQVPAEVTEALGISPESKEVASINFAGQFDTPYLLKEGASAVARVLGELTNVSTIFAAVKEASRRAKNASTLLNLRKKDEQHLVEELKRFPAITQRAKKVTEAEQILAECLELDAQISSLSSILSQLDRASEAFVELPDVPDLAELLGLHEEYSTYKNLLREIILNKQAMVKASEEVKDASQTIDTLESDLHALLVSEGKCPTCNQQILG